jgi:hypothetical protein
MQSSSSRLVKQSSGISKRAEIRGKNGRTDRDLTWRSVIGGHGNVWKSLLWLLANEFAVDKDSKYDPVAEGLEVFINLVAAVHLFVKYFRRAGCVLNIDLNLMARTSVRHSEFDVELTLFRSAWRGGFTWQNWDGRWNSVGWIGAVCA